MVYLNQGSVIIYKEITGFPSYRVGDDGSVWSRARSKDWKRLSPQIAGRDRGHHKVTLTKDGQHLNRYVHHLVLEAFVGPCPDGMETCHENDDGFDNRLTNLRWDTRSSNRTEGYRNGANHGGAEHYRAKLNEENAKEVIRMISGGMKNQKIANQFGVTRGAISGIRKGRTWKHLIDTKTL
jgi:hypothetical protein